MCNQEIGAGYIDEIKTIDQRIAVLDEQREQLLQRKQQLLNQSKAQQALTSLTTEQKLTVFKNLFRGRVDIYATRWQNKQGRSGYSVACNNEWVQGVCGKPGIKCNECSSRENKVFNEQAIYKHLAGEHVVGLYPLLTDNTCYLLAADFDKDGWQGAVRAMAQVCIQFNIPHTIEVSRSGNGAHLWIFFSDKVQARESRLLGFGLLDKAMDGTYRSKNGPFFAVKNRHRGEYKLIAQARIVIVLAIFSFLEDHEN